MSLLRAAVIGCGNPNSKLPDGKHGFAIAYAHGKGYRGSKEAQLVAAADIDQGNLQAYINEFGLQEGFTDYKDMLRQVKPDLISVCTWPSLHKEMVIEAAQAGVKGILCEKPVTFHYRDAKEMHDICREHGVVLHVCHQRRYDYVFMEIQKSISSKEIGNLLRMETWVGDGWDLMSWGIHWVDIMRFYNSVQPVDYVFGQADISARTERYLYPAENRLLTQLKFSNGVYGILHHSEDPIAEGNIVVGDEGVIIHAPQINSEAVIIGKNGKRTIKRPADVQVAHGKTIDELAQSIHTGKSSWLDSSHTLTNMQIVMAAYESARTNRAVRLPFEIDLNPLELWFEETKR